MTYDFALDKKSILLFLTGWILMALLLFVAGWLIGTQWATSANAAPGSSLNASVKEDAALPKEPVLRPDVSESTPVAPRKVVENPDQQMKSANGSSQQTGAASPLSGQQSAKAASTDVQIISAQESGLDTHSSGDAENTANESEYVTVQVGVFLDEKDASRLLKDMERKGYAPSFFSGLDAEARQWYAVRIGAYSNKQQAANAAANFTKQEKMKAVVRPLGSL